MPENKLFALVDCNNFYVSCERVFRPDLWHKPVAVLSNNDGCIVARSAEVKALGIKMATPVYQVRHLIERHQIQLFSSNYALYADMSQRVMQCLEQFTPDVEIYSIDESFLDLSGLRWRNLDAYGRQLKQRVQRFTGIPVCVGMAPTKTLAKLANYAAKKWPRTGGVLDLSDPLRRQKLMRLTPVEEVWGVGRQTVKRLNNMGIRTVDDLARQAADQIQAQFNIVMARTVLELQGVSCLSLEEMAPKQQIVCSRSFKRRLGELSELAEALTSFCARAAEKLRQQHSVTGSVTVFIRTNPFNPEEPQYQRSAYKALAQATQDTRVIVTTAKQLLHGIFKAGYRYQKCGVLLGHIQPAQPPLQQDLFRFLDTGGSESAAMSRQLMATVDNINRRFPKGIAVSAGNIGNHWQTPVEYLSPRYTTDWQGLARVLCR
ncbi:Y-family DNA polymerase [Methylomarinum vadi]|uniref:Y-family DNA polymerase n=1 Tax=Methylomarinum vadi TaxID=438855 RepID=UPI0004DEE038|nr:Y-family DNA polymerase [Methylomarinum vadi]